MPYYIPRNTKGEGRILYIFSTKGEFETKEFKILKETGPTFYSDHFFIEAVFDYKN